MLLFSHISLIVSAYCSLYCQIQHGFVPFIVMFFLNNKRKVVSNHLFSTWSLNDFLPKKSCVIFIFSADMNDIHNDLEHTTIWTLSAKYAHTNVVGNFRFVIILRYAYRMAYEMVQCLISFKTTTEYHTTTTMDLTETMCVCVCVCVSKFKWHFIFQCVFVCVSVSVYFLLLLFENQIENCSNFSMTLIARLFLNKQTKKMEIERDLLLYLIGGVWICFYL